MKLSIKLGILSSVNILLSFVIQWYIFIIIGVGSKLDAFFAGMTVPQLILAVISSSLMHILVPLFSGEDEEKLHHDIWAFLILITGFFSVLAAVLSVSASIWVPLTVPGFDKEAQDLTINLTRIQLIGMVFSGINAVQWAASHARQKFLWVEFVPILTSLFGLILLPWALPRYGIEGAAWLASLRLGLQTLLLAPYLGQPILSNIQRSSANQAWKRIKPLLIGTIFFKTDKLINRFLLSSAANGSLSLFYLATQIYEAIGYVFDKSIIGPLVPTLSKLNKQGNIEQFKKLFFRTIMITILMGLSAFIFVVIFGQEILYFLLGYGNINSANLMDLWWIMVCLNGLMLGGMGVMVVTKSFYALNNTSKPTKITSFLYAASIPAKIIAYNSFGVLGLAIATTIYQLFNFCFLIYFFQRELIKANLKSENIFSQIENR